ncbi:MAG: diacylglycerol kinase family protein [Planctomycetota bacterium]
MRAIAIVNPISGRRKVATAVEAIAWALARSGCELQTIPTQGPGEAQRIAAAAPDDTRAVLAVGGDGTVREVAAGLVGRNVPLAVFPAGTENIVARHFRMPTDPARIAAMLLRGTTVAHDVGLLNGRPFLIVCGIGFDAEVVERLTAVRGGHISYRTYVKPLWNTFRHHVFPPLVVEADGQRLFEGCGMVFVGIQPRYSLGLRILAHAAHDDGCLDVCIFPCNKTLTLVGHAFRTLLRIHPLRGGVIYRKCRTASITSPCRVPVQCDGDPAGTLPARLDILPGTLRMLLPI